MAVESKSNLTSRQLTLMAIEHNEPPRIPWTLYLSKSLEQKLTKLWGTREAWPCPKDDIIRVLWPVDFKDITDTGFYDMFGCEWKIRPGAIESVPALVGLVAGKAIVKCPPAPLTLPTREPRQSR